MLNNIYRFIGVLSNLYLITLETIFRIYYTIRNKLFPIYTGPSSVCYIGFEEEIPKALRTKGDKRKTVRVGYLHPSYTLTMGNTYQAERQDRISYYLRDDRGDLCEVSKSMFKDVSDIRNKKLKKLGI